MEKTPDTEQAVPLSWFDQNRRKLVGYGYLIGDAAIFANGMLNARAQNALGNTDIAKRRMNEAWMGLGWAVGGVAMGVFGNRPLDKSMVALEDRLAAHFAEKGLVLSEELLLRAKKEKDKGFFGHLGDFCYKYPTEILNAIYGVLALTLVNNGYKDEYLTLKDKGPVGIKDIFKMPDFGMGITIVAGALAGLLIKHKSQEQIEEEGLGSFRATIHKNASVFNGGLYLANNAFTISGAIKNKEAYKDSADAITRNMYLLRVVTAASYIGSNLLLAGGSSAEKTAAARADAGKQEILAGCVQIINAQPPELREKLIDETAKYLCQQRELGFSQHAPKRLAARLREAFSQPELTAETPAGWVGKIQSQPVSEGPTL